MDVATSKKTKRCSHCKENKALSEYVKDYSRKDGYHNRCKPCKEERRKLYRYNLSLEKYKAMLDSQNHCCADCLVSFMDKVPCIDHSHKHCIGRHSCGRCVRALVCHGCNLRRGHYERKIDKLFASIGITTVIF